MWEMSDLGFSPSPSQQNGGEVVVVGPGVNPVEIDPYGDFHFFPYMPPITFFQTFGPNIKDSGLYSPDDSIDLSDTSVVTYQFDGYVVDFIIDNKDLPENSSVRLQAFQAIDKLATSYRFMNSAAQQAIQALDRVIITDVPNRSFSDEAGRAFFLDSTELASSSSSFAASNILHDASHISIYQNTLDLNQSRGVAAEVLGWHMQVDNAVALGLSNSEINYLNGLIADPSTQDPRINQPPF